MKIKTSELTDAALDWAVAKCEGTAWLFEVLDGTSPPGASYCTDWATGGPIIERERMEVMPCMDGITWEVRRFISECELFAAYGSTSLIAAMRCFVASKLGDEIDIPEELT